MFLGSKIPMDGDCSHETERHSLFGRKTITSLNSILKSRDITLSTKVCIVKTMVFPVVMCRCELDHKEGCCCLVANMSNSFAIPWTVAARLLCPWDFPGKNARMDCHFLLQGIFPTYVASPALAGGFFTTEPIGKPKEGECWRTDAFKLWYSWELLGLQGDQTS